MSLAEQLRRMPRFLLLLLTACGGAAGTRAVDGNLPPPSAAGCYARGFPDACLAVARSTWLSSEPHECGLGATGLTSCQWGLTFEDGASFRWRHSDVVESGRYACEGFALAATTSVRGYDGRYEPACDRLVFEGVTYLRQ